MDKEQMEMLSVKNAIERMVQNYITTYTHIGILPYESFQDDVSRMVGSFYVGRQIDSYKVEFSKSSLDVMFTVAGHGTTITFLLPSRLTAEPGAWLDFDSPSSDKPSETPIVGQWTRYDNVKDCYEMFDGSKWISIPATGLLGNITSEANVRVNTSGQLELFKNGKWVTLPKVKHDSQSSDPQPAINSDPTENIEEFDPFEAYERAKKAVRNM